jgi:nucleoside phosphorylase
MVPARFSSFLGCQAYELKGRDPAVHCVFQGGIASVESASALALADNAKLRERLGTQGGFLCVDTAAAGVAAVDTLSYLVVRGICDHCDGRSSEQWQGYAAAQAASFVARLLGSLTPSAAASSAEIKSTGLLSRNVCAL